MIGTALVIGEVRGVLAVGRVVVAWALKIRPEKIEIFERFGADYQNYREKVKAVISFLL